MTDNDNDDYFSRLKNLELVSSLYSLLIIVFFAVLLSFLYYKALTDTKPEDVRKFTETQFKQVIQEQKEIRSELSKIQEFIILHAKENIKNSD